MTHAPQLFQPITLNGLSLPNRIVVAPMCQYSAKDGEAGDWHRMHLGMLATSGAGLLILEATAVSAEGRITPGCLGLWRDSQMQGLKQVVAASRSFGATRIGIQLSHAGRKASTHAPFHGGAQLSDSEGAWPTMAPSALAMREADTHPPQAMTHEDLATVVQEFVAAARRAVDAGLELIELHMAHGYLMHQFLSPLANQRHDEYGGSLDNRMRFPLAVFKAVRDAVPAAMPVGVRVSATDWVQDGWTAEETAVLSQRLQSLGCDFIHVSTGGLSPAQKITVGPGYQVSFAAQIKQACSIPVIAVGQITEPEQAEAVLAEGHADMVALGRQMLFEPHWPWRAAAALNGTVTVPPQYLRSLGAHPQIAAKTAGK